jgi:hypothetical protein
MKAGRIGWEVSLILAVILLFGSAMNSFASPVTDEIAKEIQKIKELGEPTTVEEIIPEEIPDAENGSLLYKEAFGHFESLRSQYDKRGSVWNKIPYLGYIRWDEVSSEDRKKVADFFLNNADVTKIYQLLDKASNMKCQFLKRKDCQQKWPSTYHLSQMAGCVRLLAARARFEAENLSIEKALATLLTVLRISKSISGEPLLTSQMTRLHVDSVILNCTEEVLRKGEGSADLYQYLIEEIKRDRDENVTHSGLLSERVVVGIHRFAQMKRRWIEEWNNMSHKEKQKRFEGMFGRKHSKKNMDKEVLKRIEVVADYQQLVYFRAVAKMVSQSKRPSWEVRKELGRLEPWMVGRPLKKIMFFVQDFAIFYGHEARIDAGLGNAEIALACHIYKSKHGDYPSSLRDLTPEMLASLPLDPFTGTDYIYRKNNDGFIVYSVGDDLKDDGGKRGRYAPWAPNYDIVWER